MTPNDLTEAQHECFEGLTGCLTRIAKVAPKLLTQAQRYALAEVMRDMADEFDRGTTEREKRYLSLVPKKFKAVGTDSFGRRLYVSTL